MPHATLPRRPSRLLALFVGATLVPALALAWIGWGWLDADRRLERQRVVDLLEGAAIRVSAEIDRDLAAIERDLSTSSADGAAGAAGDDATVASVERSGRVTTRQGEPLLFGPGPMPVPTEPGETFWLDAERQESATAVAISRYRAFSNAPDPAVRAGALVRLARVLVRSGRTREALDAYATLATVRDATVLGDPADLFARWARIELLGRLGETDAQRAEVDALESDLLSGRWRLERTAALAYAEVLRPWRSEARDAVIQSRIATADAVALVFRDWQSATVPAGEGGRRAVGERLVIWRDAGDRLDVYAASVAALARRWSAVSEQSDVVVSLAGADGHPVVPIPPSDGGATVERSLAQSGLPWAIRVVALSTPADIAADGARRRMAITAGLVLLGLVIPATGYLVVRAVRRELALARQQAEFVAAVSHEFRSPLTSLTHLTSLLRSDFTPTESRRRAYYDVLAHETDRLRRFVETLLDFGRIQAGATQYHLTPLDPAPIVSGVVDDFRRHAAAGEHAVSVTAPDTLPQVDADADALGRAIWNLLENAAKYSPASSPIDVSIETHQGHVAIRVRDEGSGIPAAEQSYLFDPFYRGADATRSAIKGTGVGLALVRHIVTGHGGNVTVDSAPGRGSTFSIVLPAVADAADRSAERRVS